MILPSPVTGFGPWNGLLDAPGDTTLPGFADPSGFGLPPGIRWRFAPNGQIEFGGTWVYLTNLDPTLAVPAPNLTVATLPVEARPADVPIHAGVEIDVLGVGTFGPSRMTIAPDGTISTGESPTGPVALIPYLRWDAP